MNHPYFPVLVFFGVALLVPVASLCLARLCMAWFVPVKLGAAKNAPYECGVLPLSDRQERFHSKYYLFGLLFLLFDVETVFLLPFSVAFLKLNAGDCLVALFFLLLLAEGLLWAWSKGLLHWRGPGPSNPPSHAD